MKQILLLFLLPLTLQLSFAQEGMPSDGEALTPQVIDHRIIVSSNDTQILSLTNFNYIDRIQIWLRKPVLCSDSFMRVSIDGLEGRSVKAVSGFSVRSAVVDFRGVFGRTIEFQNPSNCKVIITKVEILPRRFNQSQGGIFIGSQDSLYNVTAIVETARILSDMVSDAQRMSNLSPINKAAGKALSVLRVSPPTSVSSRNAIVNLVSVLNQQSSFIEAISSSPMTEELGNTLESAKVALERSLM